MVAANTAALASLVYNPTTDPVALKIYQTMSTSYPDDLVAQYSQTITSMPTANPFSGILQNPRSCEVSMGSTDLQTAQTTLDQRYQQVQIDGTPTNTYTPTQTQIDTLNQWNQYMPMITDNISTASSSLNNFQDHTDRTVANFSSLAGIAAAALGLAAVIGSLLDPCLGTSGFFGSLLAQGQKLMDQLLSAIQSVLNVINEVISFIADAIASVMKIIAQLTALVLSEITAFAKALIDMVRSGLANLLKDLPDDPCLSLLLGTIGTGALAYALK